MASRKSTCLYLDARVVETARQVGLNISKVSENALVEAISLLSRPKPEAGLDSPARAERAGAGIRTRAPGSTGL